MANHSKGKSTAKYSRSEESYTPSYANVGHEGQTGRYKEKGMSKMDMFLKDEESGRTVSSPEAETIAWGLRTKPGQQGIKKGKAAIAETKEFGRETKQQFEEIGGYGVTVGRAGVKGGKWAGKLYTQKLPKRIVKEASRFGEQEPGYKGMEGKIDWGLGFSAKVARVTAKETRETRMGRLASRITGRAQATYAQGKQGASRLDTRLSSASYKAAPDQFLLKPILKSAAKSKTGQYVTQSRFGKFVGGSEAAMKVKEARGKLSYARQHKAAATMKLGKMGTKGTAKFALANANFASNLIAQQDGVLAVFKPVFWSLKLVPYLTSAIVPILVVMVAILVAMMVLLCGWVSFGFLLYFLKTIPCIIVNLFMTIGNAIYFGIFAVITLIMKGFTDIINAMFYYFLTPILNLINAIWSAVAWVPFVPTYDDQSRLAFIPIGYDQTVKGAIYKQVINPTPSNALAYLVPKPIEFNLDTSSIFYGWPTGGSIIGFLWARPGVPLYITDTHGNYFWENIETGNMVKLKFPLMNWYALKNADGSDVGIIAGYDGINRVTDWWNITWDDVQKTKWGQPQWVKDPATGDYIYDENGEKIPEMDWGATGTAVGHWTFWDLLTGAVSSTVENLKGKYLENKLTGEVIPIWNFPMHLIDKSEALLGTAGTKQDGLRNAALQGTEYGLKQQVYNNYGIPWANAPEDLDRRLDPQVKYYVKSHGYCLIYNTNPWTTITINTQKKPFNPFDPTSYFLQPSQTVITTETGKEMPAGHVFETEDITTGAFPEGQGPAGPDYIFAGEPFFVDQDIMKAMKLGRYADQWDTRSRLWIIYQMVDGNLIQLAQGDDGNLYLYHNVEELYFSQLAASGIIQIDYSLPGG